MPRYDFKCGAEDPCDNFIEDEFIEFKDLDAKWPSCCGVRMENAAITTVQVSPDPYWSGLVHPHLSPDGKPVLVTSRRDFERELKAQKLYISTQEERKKPKPTRTERIQMIKKKQRRERGTFMDEVNRTRRAIQQQEIAPPPKLKPRQEIAA